MKVRNIAVGDGATVERQTFDLDSGEATVVAVTRHLDAGSFRRLDVSEPYLRVDLDPGRVTLDTTSPTRVEPLTIKVFFSPNLPAYETWIPYLKLICDLEFTKDELFEIGERVYTLERMFNYREAGYDRKDDRLPDRSYDEPTKDGFPGIKGGHMDREIHSGSQRPPVPVQQRHRRDPGSGCRGRRLQEVR